MSKKIIITGGGTGGHIFPALSIADKIKERDADTDILFVGSERGMEMELVAKYGYRIQGLNISGIQRKITFSNILKNLVFPFKLLGSLLKSRKIVRKFQPQVVVGVGGYASGPLGRAAASKKIPLVICEQNAFPGITNKWLAPSATKILLGNQDAKQFFPEEKCFVTGNPVRDNLRGGDKIKSRKKFGLKPNLPVLLILGGSLGAKTINDAIENSLQKFIQNQIQVIWQCGKYYYPSLNLRVSQHHLIKLVPFIDDMAAAYAAADLIITRAGGSTISEIMMLEKPAILVPSPNVAEDHQTKNALSLSDKYAAVLIKDGEASEKLVAEAISLVKDAEELQKLEFKLRGFPKHKSADEIVDHIFEIIEENA